MNRKSTWVLLAAASALLAYIALVEHPLRRQRELEASRIILPGLNPSLVTNIEIHPWGKAIIEATRQSSTNASWSLVRPASYPAQQQRIAALLALLAKLEWAEPPLGPKELNDRPNAQEEFGFTKPLYTLLLQGSGPDRRLEIGFQSVFGDRVFLQVVGNNTIYQAASDILRWIPWDKNLWRDPSLLNVTSLSFQTLRVRAHGNEFDLERDPTNHLWTLHKLSLVARAGTAKINDLLNRLQTLSVSNFVPDDPPADLDSYGLQSTDTTPELALTFLDHTNTVAALQMGRSSTNHPGLVFVRRDASGSIVEVAKAPLEPWQAPFTNFLDQHFISLSPSQVESIAVQGEDRFEVRKQTNGPWMVQAAQKPFPADAELMDYWLAGLTNVPTEIVKTVVTEFSEYGLSHPILQYTVRFGPQAGPQAEARLEFGTNQAGKVFERRLGEDAVNTISPNDFAGLPRVSWQLRDRHVWKFESSNVVSVTVHQGGDTNKFLRDPDGNWTYAPGFNNQVPINSPATEECVFRMGRLRAIYWDGVGDADLDRYGFDKTSHELEFAVKQGATNETFRIQFGVRSPLLHPYASVVREGERLVFEFPVDLYESLVEPNLTLPTARTAVSTTISSDEIKDFSGMADRWARQSDALSAFLWHRLSNPEQALLANYQSSPSNRPQAQEVVVRVLNRAIFGPCLYEPARFKGVSLRPATTNLLQQTPAGLNLAVLNRLLLEDAYPSELVRSLVR
jgi:hypothetical protein